MITLSCLQARIGTADPALSGLLAILFISLVGCGAPASNNTAVGSRPQQKTLQEPLPKGPGAENPASDQTVLVWVKEDPSVLTIRVGAAEPIGNMLLIGYTHNLRVQDAFRKALESHKLDKELHESMEGVAKQVRDLGKNHTIRTVYRPKAIKIDEHFIERGVVDVIGVADGDLKVSVVAIERKYTPMERGYLGTAVYFTSDETVAGAKTIAIDFDKIPVKFDPIRGGNVSLHTEDWEDVSDVIVWSLDSEGNPRKSWILTKDSTQNQ